MLCNFCKICSFQKAKLYKALTLKSLDTNVSIQKTTNLQNTDFATRNLQLLKHAAAHLLL